MKLSDYQLELNLNRKRFALRPRVKYYGRGHVPAELLPPSDLLTFQGVDEELENLERVM